MAAIMSFRDLDVYKLGLEEAKKIFILTRSIPSEEKYSLTDQIRRSSRAVNALLAKAWARRRYVAAFINKVTYSI
jgi:S23 ribosomal protein.